MHNAKVIAYEPEPDGFDTDRWTLEVPGLPCIVRAVNPDFTLNGGLYVGQTVQGTLHLDYADIEVVPTAPVSFKAHPQGCLAGDEVDLTGTFIRYVAEAGGLEYYTIRSVIEIQAWIFSAAHAPKVVQPHAFLRACGALHFRFIGV